MSLSPVTMPARNALALSCAMLLLACDQGTTDGGYATAGAGGSAGSSDALAGHSGSHASSRGGAGGVASTGSGGESGGGAGGGRADAGMGGSSSGGASTGGPGGTGVGGAGSGGSTGTQGRADAGLDGAPGDARPGRDAGRDTARDSRRPPDSSADTLSGTDTGAGEAGPAAPCQEPPNIFAWTPSWGLPHASKAVLACGVYVIGSSAVADKALLRAQQIWQVGLRKVSDDMPDLPAKLTATRSRLVILGAQEDQSIYWPNASGRRSFCSWPDSKKMIEATTLEEELTSNQRSLLMTTVHEMGHFIQFVFYAYDRTFYDRTLAAFEACTKSLYNSYDLQNAHEFFAGDTLRWFDLNPSNLAVSDAASLSQRAQLQKYSSTMYQIMSESYVTTAIP